MRIALACGLCLLAVTAVAAPRIKDEAKAEPKTSTQADTLRENFRSRMNENVVTIMAGSPTGTDLAIVQDIAEVVNGDGLRVVPMVGQGPAQNVKDVLFLRGVDMGVTQANILKYFARTGELGPNFIDQVAYVAKLFNEEMHILVREDVNSVDDLKGRPVNFGAEGSGTEITGRLVFEALGIEVKQVHLTDDDALQKLRSGEIAGTIVVTGKPAPMLANLRDTTGLKLLPVPYAKELEDSYYPATLSHDDYPDLIPAGGRVDTVAVCAVLVSFNWSDDNVRYKKLERFVDAFLGNFDQFLKPPHHPKWREVNYAATLEGWHRSPLAQAFIDRAKATASADGNTKKSFDTFLAQAAPSGSAPLSDAERAELFKAFLEWSKNQGSN
ncbi:TAXI family TRAP transporter solute-binding subunit [Methyloceanibacter sp.]|uniref:TAXI family TRAP transporter solute-binding subunit n=1 Tax=Methyloceanibacter sp. TaxID=1965321 RepID=UPI002D3639B9|nr:TAXI family TRAP transporter solute-binding subunit [Methyloceanibacter sp.]HZP09237.1 TAXI family TRAP transporter solute-binding subunit [Methyloceanibacter sp.]